MSVAGSIFEPWPCNFEKVFIFLNVQMILVSSFDISGPKSVVLEKTIFLIYFRPQPAILGTLQIHWLYSVQLLAVLRLPLSFGCTQSSWRLCAVNGCNHFKIQPKKVLILILDCACTNICPFKVGSFKVICHTFYHTLCNLKLQ